MYGWMRVQELIDWCGQFYPTWDAALAGELRMHMGLTPDAKAGTLSKGQTSKLALLLSLAHRPELVVLDDPVLGLDPLARRDFLRDAIGQLQARDVTVFFSSHLLYEIEPICDRVAILHGGKIIVSAAVDELRARVKRVEFHPRAAISFSEVPGLLDAKREDDRLAVVISDVEAARPHLTALSVNGLRPI